MESCRPPPPPCLPAMQSLPLPTTMERMLQKPEKVVSVAASAGSERSPRGRYKIWPVPPASEAGRAAPRKGTAASALRERERERESEAPVGGGGGGWRAGRLDGLIAGTLSRPGEGGKEEETVSESVSGEREERTMDVRRKKEE